jgi:hypothetical protein
MTIRLTAQGSGPRRDVVLKNFGRVSGKTGRAFNIANKKVAEFLLGKSREVVPILSKDLHDSSRVNGHGRGFDNVQEVSYNMPYALIQHEDPSYKHAPGKTSHFLTGPALQYRDEMNKLRRDTLKANTAKWRRK